MEIPNKINELDHEKRQLLGQLAADEHSDISNAEIVDALPSQCSTEEVAALGQMAVTELKDTYPFVPMTPDQAQDRAASTIARIVEAKIDQGDDRTTVRHGIQLLDSSPRKNDRRLGSRLNEDRVRKAMGHGQDKSSLRRARAHEGRIQSELRRLAS